eukprot:XP_001701922.1 predicted protein [Chlamydomonas reinhardtii]
MSESTEGPGSLGPSREASITGLRPGLASREQSYTGKAAQLSLALGSSGGNVVSSNHATGMSFTARVGSALGLGSFRKNKREREAREAAELQSGVQRAGSKSQLEIDKSIWDITNGVHVEEIKVGRLRHTWEAVCQDAKTVGETVRRDPKVAIIPFVLLLLIMGGGLWALFASANQEYKHRREIANDKALYLQTELAKAFLPAYVCSVYVRRDPAWPAVNASFGPMALEMIRLSHAGSVLTLSLIPWGFNQDKVLQSISSKNLTIIGPYNLTQGGIGLVAMLSINIAHAAPSAAFDIPPYVHGSLGAWQTPPRTQVGPNLTDTPYAPYMYDEATSSKWWGLTTVLISWDVLREDVTRLDDLEAQGYSYVLSRPVLRKELLQARPDLANGTHDLAVAWSSSVQERLDGPVHARVLVEGAQLDLYLSLDDGWTPRWKQPMVAVTCVLSFLFSLMLFLVLVNRRQHMRLLHAMIPKKVIETLRRGKIFTESFEVVTVLFSDIVAYTTMSAHMAPIEVVQMLDELYQEFDNLAEKHKLYKLDTIGDAFMLMGLDMIRVTSTKILAGGHVVKIRVGIHSGPAVAAVVGRKAPKYTLFGDTVNTASRMESNGSPMRIHISMATHGLLQEAGGFMMEPRGEIPIKGKGVMSTFWVTGTHVWEQGPCPRSEAVDISSLPEPNAAALMAARGSNAPPPSSLVPPPIIAEHADEGEGSDKPADDAAHSGASVAVKLTPPHNRREMMGGNSQRRSNLGPQELPAVAAGGLHTPAGAVAEATEVVAGGAFCATGEDVDSQPGTPRTTARLAA